MMDFLPTAAHLAGVAIPETRRIDGQNIWPLLSDEADAQPPGSQEFLYFRGLNLEAIRIGKWKLHLAKQELYDLAADIGEAHDIAQDHPKVVERLTRRAKAVDGDLGTQGVGPGCRELGRVEQAVPLIPLP
jgi:arylsulfatase A-like enzyme